MQKFVVYLLYKIESHGRRLIAAAIVLLVLFLLVRSTTWVGALENGSLSGRDDRYAATVSKDVFGDSFSKVVYLNQGWDSTDSLWFYNTTQGSDLLPYDFFVSLEQADSEEPFTSRENMNRYRYLPQNPSGGDPDGLPVGMVADTYCGKRVLGLQEKYCGKTYVGFTCAACHSSQVNVNGVGIRIDGGPAAADMDGFMSGLAAALDKTLTDPNKRTRFVSKVRDRCTFTKSVSLNCDYRSNQAVLDDLKTYALHLKAYNFFNASYYTIQKKDTPLEYGYGRLDAFGRIYNRVLEHVTSRQGLVNLLTPVLGPDQLATVMAKVTSKTVLSAEDRDSVEQSLMDTLAADTSKLDTLRKGMFNSPNAPVSYPFLWDIPQSDFVQWNGIGANAGAGPLGRNTGEVIGVFATLDWEATERWMPAPLTGFLGLGPKDIRFQSSAKGHNLGQIEDRLKTLQAPKWEEAHKLGLLPEFDSQRVTRGRQLYNDHCLSCHAVIKDTTDPGRRVVAQMEKFSVAGTDQTMANNSVQHQGYSGILRDQYASTDVGSLLLTEKMPVATLLIKATENVVATPDPDKWFFTRWADWAVDLIRGIHGNPVKASAKQGNYLPDTPMTPFSSLLAYKSRPLDGIWATAPYLHNGSVPTLYDLLLPPSQRPTKFTVGSREFDPVHVGFKSSGYTGFVFDTSLPATAMPAMTTDLVVFRNRTDWIWLSI